MIDTIELTSLDTRHSRLRLRDHRREQMLLSSISEQGILDPLYVVNPPGESCILLDGFKRYRCASRLKHPDVPVVTLDANEAVGMLKLLRLSASKSMSPLEEACLVDELHQRHGLSVSEISRRLERSVSWVSVRLGILTEMSAEVREKIFAGHFPVRSYMYTLRPFTRVNSRESKKEVESFIKCVSSKRFSTRDIDILAGAWFKGGKMLKSQIKQGNLDWTLRQLKTEAVKAITPCEDLTGAESKVLSSLGIVTAYIYKLTSNFKDADLKSEKFFINGRRAAGRLMSILDDFKLMLKEFYEECGKKTNSADAFPGG